MGLKWIIINGLRVRYAETVGQDEVPLLILHGWGSSIDSWLAVLEELENRKTKAFLPDLPGFGKTPEPPAPWGISDYLNFIEGFKKELGIKKFNLAGHSFGGQLAISYAAQDENNLRKLILISAARIIKRKVFKVNVFLVITKIGNLIFDVPLLSFLRPFAQKIWYKLTGERDYYNASDLMRETFKRIVGEEVGSRLEAIRVPALILWGEMDDVTPLSDAKIIQSRIAKSQLHVFSGDGHDINIKKPREIAEKIYTFLKE